MHNICKGDHKKTNTDTLYRHEALLYAIDFFTQNFEVSQVTDYAFDFINEILTLNSSALFLKKDEKFDLYKSKNYGLVNYSLKDVERLKNIATFHGDIIKSNFKAFLCDQDINILKPRLIIPLLVKDKVLGLLVTGGKVLGELDTDDYIIATALMRLINKSLENTINLSELKEKNKELDIQIFNMFFIHQTSKTLLSELNTESLYSLCTDIIGEVTTSKITSFGLYDPTRERIVIKGHRDTTTFNKYYTELELKNKEYNKNKVILNYKEDLEIVKRIFKNWWEFENLDAKYIILIVKKDILGFITISEPVNDREYDKLMFELIESLSSIIYISITNANLFERIKKQKSLIEKKYNVLDRLNRLMKSINSSSSKEELIKRIVKILNIGFNIEKGFIALKENNKYVIRESIGFDVNNYLLTKNDNWIDIDIDGCDFEYSSNSNCEYFDSELMDIIGTSNCRIISPIKLEDISSDIESNIFGYIVILKARESISTEEVTLIKTLTNNIAPIIKHMNEIDIIKEKYVPDQEKLFISKIKEKLKEREEFFIDFNIFYKKLHKKPFNDVDLSDYEGYEYYYFDNYLFVIDEDEISNKIFDGYFIIDSTEDLYKKISSI